eukprot:15005497-Alexandrium_andersonii.AAC.1
MSTPSAVASSTCRVVQIDASRPSLNTCRSSQLPHRTRPSSRAGAKSPVHAALASHPRIAQ